MTGLILGTLLSLAGNSLLVEVNSLSKGDLPDDFPAATIDVHVAVLKIRIVNQSSGLITIKPDSFLVREKGKKKLKRARSTDITPKIVKRYRPGRSRLAGESRAGAPTIVGNRTRPLRIGEGAAAMIDVERTQELKRTLERYELTESSLIPGEALEGFFYVESDKRGNALTGTLEIEGKKVADF